jgi:hypothetical protein
LPFCASTSNFRPAVSRQGIDVFPLQMISSMAPIVSKELRLPFEDKHINLKSTSQDSDQHGPPRLHHVLSHANVERARTCVTQNINSHRHDREQTTY